MGGKSKFLIFLVLMLWVLASPYPHHHARADVPSRPNSTPPSLEDARYHIQNLYNEMELLVHNSKSDETDLKKQEREFGFFRLYERIPFKRDVPGIEQDLRASARDQGFKFSDFKVLPSQAPAALPVPREIYTDDRNFKLHDNQLAEAIPVSFRVEGDRAAVDRWIASWPTQVLRLVKPTRAPRAVGDAWQVEGVAYRFKTLQFPRLVPRNPLSLVPAGAKAHLAETDPALWKLTRQVEELRPRTPKLYATRGRFLLDGARMEFLLRRLNGSR